MCQKLKLLILNCIFILTALIAKGQADSIDMGNRTFQQVFDSINTGLIKSRVPYGVLYDRVYPWSDLLSCNDSDTVSSTRFFQAWWDMENSHYSEAPFTPGYNDMRTIVQNNLFDSIITLMNIRYNYSYIDPEAFDDGRMSYTAGQLFDNNLASPYLTKSIGIIALPGDTFIRGVPYTLHFDTTIALNNTPHYIDHIEYYNLTSGTYDIIGPQSDIPVTFDIEGINWLKIIITLENGEKHTTKQKINVKPLFRAGSGCEDPVTGLLVRSNIPFQGYDESDATTSIGNYSIYYHTYPTCQHKIKKPIIILDGFDPQDVRKIDYIYNNSLMYYTGSTPTWLGDQLRAKGYDVIILNFPVLGNDVPKTVQKLNTGGTFTDVDRPGRDGGTDYIERNSYLLVKLIQEVNDSLTTNSSSEKLVIIGPSMGGQISRYALAYMEQQHYLNSSYAEHNCRLWGSFDSPHLGANIPVGLQATLNFYGNLGGEQQAANALNKKVLTIAAKQMLIEQLNGLDNTNIYRQTYIYNLTHNGLAGSNGWPQNLRKVAMVNGSGTGHRDHYEQEEFLHLEGFAVFDIKGIEFIDNFVATPASNSRVFHGSLMQEQNVAGFIPAIATLYQNVYVYNSNSNGSMDVVPAGIFDAQGEIKSGFDESLQQNKQIKHYNWDNYLPYHAFIPTVSALGFKDPNFNWNSALNDRNLVCNNEIYFDNYYFQIDNQLHSSLHPANVDWAIQEIDKGLPDCPSICATAISGTPSWLCTGSIATYSLNSTPPSGTTTTWTVSSGLQINSSNATSVTVQATSYHINAFIKATITNPCGADVVIIKNIISGSPSASISFYQMGNSCEYEAIASPNLTGCTFEWSDDGSSFSSGTINYGDYTPETGVHIPVWVRVTTPDCGTISAMAYFTIENNPAGCMGKRTIPNKPVPIIKNRIDVFPNPSSDFWNIMIYDYLNNKTDVTLTDFTGRQILYQSYESLQESTITLTNKNLCQGIYFIKVQVNGETKIFKAVKY
jgi:hypothetical protein